MEAIIGISEDQGVQVESLDRMIGGLLVANEVRNLQETKGLTRIIHD